MIFNKYGYFIEFNTIDINSVKVELSFQSKEIVKILKAAKKLLYKNIFLNLCTRSFTHPYYLCMIIRKSVGEYIYKRKQQKILYLQQDMDFIIPENNLYYFSKHIKVEIGTYAKNRSFWYCNNYKSRLKALNILINLYKNKR